MINNVSIVGNMTKDAELKKTKSGKSVANFSIAVNESRKDENGNWVDHPHYFECVVFGGRADSLAKFTRKGSKVAISGRLNQNRWKDDNGNNRSKVEIMCDTIEFMFGKFDSQPQADVSESVYDESVYSSDIPF